jgi:hypothetical protein
MFENQCRWLTGASSGIGAALGAVVRTCKDARVLPFEATDFARADQIADRA